MVEKLKFQMIAFSLSRSMTRLNSIVHETKVASDHYRLPSNSIIIGNNGGGDVLVYKIENGGFIDPKVYWFNSETEELEFAANEFNES